MRVFVFLVLAMLSPSIGLSQGAAPTNALWNDSGAKGELGFWVFRGTGGCPDLRIKGNPLLMFSPKTQKDEYAVSDLQFCVYVNERKVIVECRSGKISLTRDASGQRYTGTYSLVMADRSKQEGSFEAQYCAKGN